ncbi:uncharacterized protein EV420DRAFT_1559447 [Desarmillaria tabescens]|uniref:Uncharacterized protein n=1 Tax=Armillaria tabescens TaxID=1929756 RepID=A0AA39K0T5_ARMTA|nr:uncharacterized protein EV420DRAFT_1559447 [Desarmillaria tabescens]KAK0452202.1 hypothetical protein EV420DRAFT_1559447 [Desarmillaria tabescens]
MHALAVTILSAMLSSVGAQCTATYLPDTAPDKTEQGQTGTNKWETTSSQGSMCKNVHINAVDDFCLWAPPTLGPDSTVGATERRGFVVSQGLFSPSCASITVPRRPLEWLRNSRHPRSNYNRRSFLQISRA